MKFAGAGLIIFSCYYIGLSAGRNELAAFKEICGFIRFFEYLEQRITFSGEKLADIFGTFSDEALEKCGFLKTIRSPKGQAYCDVWEAACEFTNVNKDVKRQLILFGKSLGKVDTVLQKEQTALCKSFLTAEKNRTEPALNARLKSGKALGALAGALIAIILL